jgi:hypothetical protein
MTCGHPSGARQRSALEGRASGIRVASGATPWRPVPATAPSPHGGAVQGAGGTGPVQRRLRQRGLLYLLRPGGYGLLRPGADPGCFHHLGLLLPVHGSLLRGGHRGYARGGGLHGLRPSGLQRYGELRGRVGADPELHRHHRHLGICRAGVPLGVRAGAGDLAHQCPGGCAGGGHASGHQHHGGAG